MGEYKMSSKQLILDNKEEVEVSEIAPSRPAVAKKNAGQLLRKARLAKGYKVTQVVQKLNISEDYIKAIENSDFERLPPELTYSLGFVRAYAQLVDLEVKEIMGLFKTDFLGLEEVPEGDVALMTLTPKPKATMPFIYIALAGGALILSMGYFASKKNPGNVPLVIQDSQIPAAQ